MILSLLATSLVAVSSGPARLEAVALKYEPASGTAYNYDYSFSMRMGQQKASQKGHLVVTAGEPGADGTIPVTVKASGVKTTGGGRDAVGDAQEIIPVSVRGIVANLTPQSTIYPIVSIFGRLPEGEVEIGKSFSDTLNFEGAPSMATVVVKEVKKGIVTLVRDMDSQGAKVHAESHVRQSDGSIVDGKMSVTGADSTIELELKSSK